MPAGSGPEELVVNGMSASARSSIWANSGMVVEIRPGDFPEYAGRGEFEMLDLVEDLEKKFYKVSNESIIAPAQRMKDFVDGKDSKNLPPSSYLQVFMKLEWTGCFHLLSHKGYAKVLVSSDAKPKVFLTTMRF